MNTMAIDGGARSVAFAEVTATIRRADGQIERVLLHREESAEHRAEREAAGLELPAPAFTDPPPRRNPWLARMARWFGIGAIAFIAHRWPAAFPGLGAATLLVNGAHAIVTNRITGAGTEPKFVAWGTGAGTAGATDTTLFTESTDESRTSGTSSRVTTTVTNDTYQVVGTITVATAGKTITNVGLFDASTSGNLYFKSDFTGLALSVGDSITFTIKVKYS